MVLAYSPIYMSFNLIRYLLLLSSSAYKVKIIMSLPQYFLHTRERGSSPGVVWCINKGVFIIIIINLADKCCRWYTNFKVFF